MICLGMDIHLQGSWMLGQALQVPKKKKGATVDGEVWGKESSQL